MSVRNIPTSARLPWPRLGLAALIAMVGAAVSNVIVYALAGAVGVDWSYPLPQTGAPIPIVAPAIASLIGVGAGMVVLAALNAFAAQPLRWFTIVAPVVLVLSLLGPIGITGAALGFLIALELMHVIAGLFAIITPWFVARR